MSSVKKLCSFWISLELSGWASTLKLRALFQVGKVAGPIWFWTYPWTVELLVACVFKASRKGMSSRKEVSKWLRLSLLEQNFNREVTLALLGHNFLAGVRHRFSE